MVAMDTRHAGPRASRAEQRQFASTLKSTVALGRHRKGNELSAPTVPNISSKFDDDDEVFKKMQAALGEAQERTELQLQEAMKWRAEARALRRRIKRGPWSRGTWHERAGLEEELAELQERINKAEVVEPHRQQNRVRRFERLKALWVETGGSGRRIHNKNSTWAVAMHGSRLAQKREERNVKRREELDTKELLAWSVMHSIKDSGVMLSNSDVCPKCYKSMMMASDGQLFCGKCILFFDNSNMGASSMMLDMNNAVRRGGRQTHSTPYQSHSHFLERIKNIMGTWRNIPPHVFTDVTRYLFKFKVPAHDHSTLWVGREALAATGNHDFYHQVHLILSHISAVAPPQIPPVLQSEMSILIRMIHPKWKEIQRLLDDEKARQDKLAGRKVRRFKRNSPNVGYCLDFIAVLRGHPELCTWNWAIHDPINVRLKDSIMELVCRTYNWEFTPTKPKRLAGDAGAATERRKTAFALAESTLDDHDWRPRTEAERKAQDRRRQTRRGKKKGDPKECRGINFHAARRLGKEVWMRVDFVVRTILNWRMFLSEFNPWEEIPQQIMEVEKLAIEDTHVHNIRQFIASERKEAATPTLPVNTRRRLKNKKKNKKRQSKKREAEDALQQRETKRART